MPVAIYKANKGVGPISHDGTFSNAILFEATVNGGVYEQQYFVGSDNSLHEDLTACTMLAVDSRNPSSANYFSFALDNLGTPGTYGPSIQFSVPHQTYLPVWIKATVPAQPGNLKTTIQIAVSYTANTV